MLMRLRHALLATLVVLAPGCDSPAPGALDGPLPPVDGPVDSLAALPDTPALDAPFSPDAAAVGLAEKM